MLNSPLAGVEVKMPLLWWHRVCIVTWGQYEVNVYIQLLVPVPSFTWYRYTARMQAREIMNISSIAKNKCMCTSFD